MLRRGLRLCQAAQPISKTEFLDAFSRVHPHGIPYERYKLGLAVSGGVDSMALAAMCHEYLPRDKIKLHGLIVDHRLRPTSSQEAQTTSETLKTRLGMQTQIMPITDTRTEGLGVEGWARARRFDAIVQTSRRLGIKDILLAHHEDDLYENILLRLSGQGRQNLGIGDVTMCNQWMEYLADTDTDVVPVWKPPNDSGVDCLGVQGVPDMEIFARRPLLHFPKDRLVATSKALGISWIEDKTNQDPKFAMRNALRHILATRKLPAALSKESLIHLWRGKPRAASANTVAVTNKLFELTHIKVDIRTGSAIVTLPTPNDIATHLSTFNAASSSLTKRSLRRVIGQYYGYLSNLIDKFQGFSPPADLNALWRRPVSAQKSFTHSTVLYTPQPDARWLLTIKKFPSNIPPLRARAMVVEFRHESIGRWSSWRIFDFRWWLRVQNPSPTQVVYATYLKEGHLERLRARLASGDLILRDISDSSGTSRNLETILKSLGPHELRWRLPVLTLHSGAEEDHLSSLSRTQIRRILFEDDPGENVLAFPTLGLKIHPKQTDAAPSWIEALKWECWYKPVSWMEGRFEDSMYVPRSLEARGLVWPEKRQKLIAKKEKGASSVAEWLR